MESQEPIEIASRWQLQWEVDQEADEILGGLLPSSPIKASPPYEHLLMNATTHPDMQDLNFMDFFEGQEQHEQQQEEDHQQHQQPIEDLDNLEPGWDLNEGFEWGPATEEVK